VILNDVRVFRHAKENAADVTDISFSHTRRVFYSAFTASDRCSCAVSMRRRIAALSGSAPAYSTVSSVG
jgi:hypothetical protein